MLFFSPEPNKGRIRLSALSSGLDGLKGLPPSIFESVARPPIIALRIWNGGGRAEIYQDFTAIWRAADGGGGPREPDEIENWGSARGSGAAEE